MIVHVDLLNSNGITEDLSYVLVADGPYGTFSDFARFVNHYRNIRLNPHYDTNQLTW